jgi:hypothetical protein
MGPGHRHGPAPRPHGAHPPPAAPAPSLRSNRHGTRHAERHAGRRKRHVGTERRHAGSNEGHGASNKRHVASKRRHATTGKRHAGTDRRHADRHGGLAGRHGRMSKRQGASCTRHAAVDKLHVKQEKPSRRARGGSEQASLAGGPAAVRRPGVTTRRSTSRRDGRASLRGSARCGAEFVLTATLRSPRTTAAHRVAPSSTRWNDRAAAGHRGTGLCVPPGLCGSGQAEAAGGSERDPWMWQAALGAKLCWRAIVWTRAPSGQRRAGQAEKTDWGSVGLGAERPVAGIEPQSWVCG